MKLSYHTVKEAYETMKSEMKSIERRLSKYIETTRFLKAKQRVLNQYIHELAEVKRELTEKEKKVNKHQSYHASLYILERIFYITPDDNNSERTKRALDWNFIRCHHRWRIIKHSMMTKGGKSYKHS
ncbi:hypothetical protein Hanom_Chr16g01452241 [Helianthus anomalus]